MNKTKRLFILIGCICLVSAVGCGKEVADISSDLPSEEAFLTDDSEDQKATEDADEVATEANRGLAVVRVSDIPGWNTAKLNEGEQDAFIDEFMGENVSQREPDYAYDTDKDSVKLWYDLEQDKGCGIFQNSYGIQGFTFEGHKTLEWKPENIFDFGTKVYNMDEISNCQKMEEYDDAGRLISNGIVADWEYSDEPITVYWAEYQYREDGTLEQQKFTHDSRLFGTYGSPCTSYYDEQERLLYRTAYISAGSAREYYIYENDSHQPSYLLSIEYTHGPVPVFYVYE